MTTIAPAPATVEAELFDDDDELLEQLKADNPRSRLAELCARLKVRVVSRETRTEHGYAVDLSVRIQGEPIASGVCRAAERKAAKQLAAQLLLDRIEHRLGERGARVTPGYEAKLQSENPKGQLLETCVAARIDPPRFAIEADPQGWRGSAVLALGDGRTVTTPPMIASSRKTLEQALSADLLARATRIGFQPPLPVELKPKDRDARMMLNEMKQAKWISLYGYDVLGHRGPPRWMFRISAWCILPSGARLVGDARVASTKKAAEELAADALLDVLEEARAKGA